ncbi:MAG TPA: hypothetical protein DCS83_03470 [Prevotella sp.]|nr:hypothetical protein [Prevotella sp.]
MTYSYYSKKVLIGLITLITAACSEDNTVINNPNTNVGKDVGNFKSAEWYPGGIKGTTTNEEGCYSNPVPIVADNDSMYTIFKKGETFFDHDFAFFSRPYTGLGPAWVRSGCEYCHPSYGHGKRQTSYHANTMGNGYLLVIYHPTAGTDNGIAYQANSYISEVTGMPQTKAMNPFKAPVDENQITITWNTVTSMPSGLAMTFPDGGDSFQLIYPEVNIPQTAFHTDPLPDNYDVRLESTIGMYGTGLLDAISSDSMKIQYAKEAAHTTLNPAMWNSATNDWASSAYYSAGYNDLGSKKMIKKFTYAMTRASLQDGPGANAMWNITNVTRSDRHFLYTTDAWAKAMSEDPEVINNIQSEGKSNTSLLHPYYADGSKDSIAYMVNKLLGLNAPDDTPDYQKYFVNNGPWNGNEEMNDYDYYTFAVWHRSLAVPQARNLDNEQVQRGKELFYSWGCTRCHRPSWHIDKDNGWLDAISRKYCSIGKGMPDYSNTTIYPYTDLVQHRLHMANDIRTGWCRTTPLWGRGLSEQETGEGSRLHDDRARNVTEAIMWHCYSKESDAYPVAVNFYHASKSDRDAVIAFINSI